MEDNSSNEMILIAEQLKSEGNELFRAGNFKEAIGKYAKIFLYTNGLVAKKDSVAMYARDKVMNEDQENVINDLKHTANANMAAAYLSLKQYQKVIEKSKLALAIKDNPKVLYRRALAYIETGDIDNAKIDLDKASLITPNDPVLQSAYKKLSAKTEIVLNKEKKKYKGFFDKLSDN